MAFLRQKKTKAGTMVFSIVESRRIEGKIQQKVLAYLGQSDSLRSCISALESQKADCEEQLKKSADFVSEATKTLTTSDGHIVQRDRRKWKRVSMKKRSEHESPLDLMTFYGGLHVSRCIILTDEAKQLKREIESLDSRIRKLTELGISKPELLA